MIHRNLITSPGSRSSQFLAHGDASPQGCSPTPVAGPQTSSHTYTHTPSCTLWIPPVTGLRHPVFPVASLGFPGLQLHTDTHMHICLSVDPQTHGLPCSCLGPPSPSGSASSWVPSLLSYLPASPACLAGDPTLTYVRHNAHTLCSLWVLAPQTRGLKPP